MGFFQKLLDFLGLSGQKVCLSKPEQQQGKGQAESSSSSN
jgi:hypothetical protein